MGGLEKGGEGGRLVDGMGERLGKHSLSLHPEKTRLIEFGRNAAANRKRRGLGKPETFSFLGFIFISGKSRRGKIQAQRESPPQRISAKVPTRTHEGPPPQEPPNPLDERR